MRKLQAEEEAFMRGDEPATGCSACEQNNYLFDRVVVINLDRRPEKMKHFREVWKNVDVPWPTAHRVRAVDGQKVPKPWWFDSGAGAWGCYMSHLRELERALMDGVKSILLLEDDAVPMANFDRRLKEFIEHLPDDWDGLFLGGQHLKQNLCPPILVNPHVLRCYNVNRTHAWALRGDAIKKTYQFLVQFRNISEDRANRPHHIDHQLGVMHERMEMNFYAPAQWLMAQGAGESDISGDKHERRWDKHLNNLARPAVAVMGLPRSGSSCTAGILHALGVHLGGNLSRRDKLNAKGYFEAAQLSQQLRKAMNEPEIELQMSESELELILARWYRDSRLRVKDPKVMIGAKHYLLGCVGPSVARAWGYNMKVIVPDRPVEQVIASLERTGWKMGKPENARQIVERTLALREPFLANHPHVLRFNFEDLLTDPRTGVRRIVEFLGIRPSEDQIEQAIAFVDPSLVSVKAEVVV